MFFAKIFARNYKKDNTCNIRRLVDESFVPATQRIILKIVGFLVNRSDKCFGICKNIFHS